MIVLDSLYHNDNYQYISLFINGVDLSWIDGKLQISGELLNKLGVPVQFLSPIVIMDGKEYKPVFFTKNGSMIWLHSRDLTFFKDFFNKLEEYCKNKFREQVKGVLLEEDRSSAIFQSEIKQLRKEIKEIKQSAEMTQTNKIKDLREFYISSIGRIENRIKILQQKLKRSDKHFFLVDKKTGQFIF